MKDKAHYHAGHRDRMRERYLQSGSDSFSPHELVELLLYYAIPQKDVNDLSHRLIERFGSLAGVLDADFEELLSVEGVGRRTALLFKLCLGVNRAYARDKEVKHYVYDTIDKVAQHFINLYIGAAEEQAYVMLFDNSMRLLDTVLVAKGAVNAVNIQMRSLIEAAIKKKASAVIFAHNHPNGNAIPSQDDVSLTGYMEQALEMVNISLIDHLVISGRYYTPIVGKRRSSYCSSDPLDLAERFYDEGEPVDAEKDITAPIRERYVASSLVHRLK